MNLNNCVVCLYRNTDDGIDPLVIKELIKRKIQKQSFSNDIWIPANTSKFGIQINKNATHWGVFDLSDTKNPKALIYGELYGIMGENLSHNLENMYVHTYASTHYLKFFVSEYENRQVYMNAVHAKTKNQKG